jgi:hypothetical protein
MVNIVLNFDSNEIIYVSKLFCPKNYIHRRIVLVLEWIDDDGIYNTGNEGSSGDNSNGPSSREESDEDYFDDKRSDEELNERYSGEESRRFQRAI